VKMDEELIETLQGLINDWEDELEQLQGLIGTCHDLELECLLKIETIEEVIEKVKTVISEFSVIY